MSRRMRQQDRLTETQRAIRDCLRSDPEEYPADPEAEETEEEEEEEEEESWRTIYVRSETDSCLFFGMHVKDTSSLCRIARVVRFAVDAREGKGVERAIDVVEDSPTRNVVQEDDTVVDKCVPDRSILTKGKDGSLTMCSRPYGGIQSDVTRRFVGTLYDDALNVEKARVLRTAKEFSRFREMIVSSHPKFMPGARKIVGSTPSKDPLLTGAATIDFETRSLIVRRGQVRIEDVTSMRSGSGRLTVTVWWRYDWTQRKTVRYAAAEVPRVPVDARVVYRWIAIGPPKGAGRVGLRPMTLSHPVRVRRRGPPRLGPPRRQTGLKLLPQHGRRAPPRRPLRRSKRLAAKRMRTDT